MAGIQKQQFRNNLDGWVGAVVIGPKGDDRGIPVEPLGTVWLSEPEQILTANASRSPADNPFVAQEWPRFNPTTGEMETVKVTPLTPVDEGRFVPAQQRFIPGVEAEGVRGVNAATVAATGQEPVSISAEGGHVERREAEVLAGGTHTQPNPPPSAPKAAADAARAAQEAREAEAARQIAAQEAAQGAVPPPLAAPQPPPAPVAPDPPAAPEPPAADVPVGEETAAVVDQSVGEETGAALPPQGDATAGTFSPGEEVGTPDAPQQPPPYAPPEG